MTTITSSKDKFLEFLPINIDLKSQPCLVVGGGETALRKGRLLIKAGANVCFLAPNFVEPILRLANAGKAELSKQLYQSDCLDKQTLIIAATNDIKVNQQISQDARERRLLVNVVDQKSLCNFIMPSLVNRGALSVSISSSGAAPVLARMIREKLEWMLPQDLESQLVLIESKRAEVAEQYPTIEARREFWEAFFESFLGWSVAENIQQASGANLSVEKVFDNIRNQKQETNGEICFVDLGCGEAESLTVATLKKLQKVDEVYLSKRLESAFENLLRRDAIRHDFELSGGEASLLLNNEVLIDELNQHVLNGKKVCLLNLNNQFEDSIEEIKRFFQRNSWRKRPVK